MSNHLKKLKSCKTGIDLVNIFSNELDTLVDSDLFEFERYIKEIISIILVKNNERY